MKRSTLMVLALALVAAACGDDDATTTVESTSSTTTVAATTTSRPVATTTVDATTTTTPTPSTRAACDHEYMPARAGNTWVYETGSGEMITWEVIAAEDDGLSAILAAEILSGETGEQIVPIEVNLMCGGFGMQAPELAMGGLPFGATVTQVVEEGVFLPPASEMVPGGSWTSIVNITAEFTEAPGMVVEIRREVTYTVVGEEEVTVPAGTFTALRVDSEFVQEMAMGATALPAFTGSQTQWFAPGIGLIAERGDFEGSPFDLQLVEVTIP